MGHEELKEVGIKAFGHRHKILKGVKERVRNLGPGKVFVGLTNFYMVILEYFVDDHGRKKITRFEQIDRMSVLKVFVLPNYNV